MHYWEGIFQSSFFLPMSFPSVLERGKFSHSKFLPIPRSLYCTSIVKLVRLLAAKQIMSIAFCAVADCCSLRDIHLLGFLPLNSALLMQVLSLKLKRGITELTLMVELNFVSWFLDWCLNHLLLESRTKRKIWLFALFFLDGSKICSLQQTMQKQPKMYRAGVGEKTLATGQLIDGQLQASPLSVIRINYIPLS